MKNLSKNNKKLRIAQIAPLWVTIPPLKYGGIERIVAMLCDGLAERGHRVTLFAAPGSKTKAKLITVFDKALLDAKISWSNPIWNLRNLSKAFEIANRGEFDIIHSHLDLWALFFQGLTKTPVLHTMHNPLYVANADANKDDRLRLFKEEAKRTNIVLISKSARNQAMVKFPKERARVIYNGIDLSHFKFNSVGGDHFVWIARMNKHKGVENAIAAAEKMGVKLLLAGRIDPTQKKYFRKFIKPHLNKKIKYVGELTENQLSDFYGPAKALLYPIEWEEPFGLVVAEAMACGTPVIAYRRGSMSELIENGKTGFVVDSKIDLLVEAMKKVNSIDRTHVRKRVEQKFGKEKMVDNYEKLYYKLCLKK
ncbi:MAG: glycosyl transferase [Candidatus Portnoybacteria bacterium CG10_big_fil_rev_8_21_14_0_10_38_18]|uniref:Glycosyl transferase n=1 Tax=Candidatus Portnoybacteria bacterium CG10_big_fil_rev_8_21_14_0_10_38_18 TaxID=1974813 RepID=A0A2M8KC10_9BACT|nr:MAG: glycosyl transferase [Candidatus Portnoybacteria bacterium CG10_big_fil_rev_8_21_14_0_10_38_18]